MSASEVFGIMDIREKILKHRYESMRNDRVRILLWDLSYCYCAVQIITPEMFERYRQRLLELRPYMSKVEYKEGWGLLRRIDVFFTTRVP